MTEQITWRLEHENVGRLLLHYAIPAVIGTMVNALYNIVDRIFIGQGVGPLAISGLTLTFPILMFLQAFGMLIGAGAATRVSIHLGRKAKDKAEDVLGNAFTLTFIISALTIIPSLVFMRDLLVWFGGSEQTIPYAEDYLYFAIPANLLASLSFGFNAVMRASGYPRKAMVTMMIGALANVILDPIFIFWLDMGIQGAAIATVISMTLSASFVMYHFLQKESLIRFHVHCFRLKSAIVWNILTIGVSPFAMQLAGSMVNVVMNHALKKYGGDMAIGASGIMSSVAMLLVMMVLGIAHGMQPIVGYNYGAGQHKRVFDTLRLVIIVSTCITGAGFFCCLFFPETIAQAFTNDPEMVKISSNALRLTLLGFLPVGSQIAISQFFQSIGIAWKAMFLSLSRQVLFLIPAVVFLPLFFDLNGVWLAGPFSDIIAVATAWVFLGYHVKSVQKKHGL